MSGGEQQMLAMGRALMANPTLLLETGRVALSNDSQALRDDPEVQKAYLGT